MSYIVGSSQQLIGQQVLGGTTATVTFSSIPQNFNHLKLLVTARGDTAATNVVLKFNFNSDTGANYDIQNMYGINNTTIAAGAATGQNYLGVGPISSASATANYAGVANLFIYSYTKTTFYKNTITTIGYNSAATTNCIVETTAGTWRNTAAITTIAIAPVSGNFVTGSCFYLYGVL